MMGNRTVYTEAQMEHRLYEVQQMYFVDNMTQEEIADTLGVSQPQVSKYVNKLKDRWRHQSDLNVNEALQKELVLINLIQSEYFQGWQLSKQEISRTREEFEILGAVEQDSGADILVQDTVEGEATIGALVKSKVVVTKGDGAGNPAFLQGVERMIDKRVQLLGIKPSEKVELAVKSGQRDLLTKVKAILSTEKFLELLNELE